VRKRNARAQRGIEQKLIVVGGKANLRSVTESNGHTVHGCYLLLDWVLPSTALG
jgi:hypothetical protein